MTGTDLCVNCKQSVPVIFEPPCIRRKIIVISKMSIWFYYFEMLTNQHCSSNTCRSQHMPERKQENVSGVILDDITAVTPRTRVFWDGYVKLCRWLNSFRRIAVPTKFWERCTQ